ncbi:hypothetical protein NP233_g118 [Leucocoprinus birnbaumii]|uniref:SH3 domain-containing protein n=1 Tax=Leucocoprinus birnbaumii TaxID=56174 RepID=A0AAD5W2J3_9AGAR|nr:hypothetical protein NP233_g118 [Leucocoprinus birnbaumii]
MSSTSTQLFTTGVNFAGDNTVAASSDPTISPTPDQNPSRGGQVSHDSHTAMIISAVTLALVLITVSALIFWYGFIRRRRKKSQKDFEQMGYLDKERGMMAEAHEGNHSIDITVTSDVETDGGTLRDGVGREAVNSERGSQRTFGSFNPLDMVVRRSFMNSRATSQVTGTSNPPPPYANASDHRASGPGNDADQIPTARTPNPQRISSLQPPNTNFLRDIRDSESEASPLPERPAVLSTTNNSVSGPAVGLAAMARMLPNTMTVQLAFTSTKADELSVEKGERLRIIGVYDDGWCLCKAENGEKIGVVPLACLENPDPAQANGEDGV